MKKIAIVGRPNVGKSALFNRIIGKRLSIVDEAEGVTRDRLYAETNIFEQSFQVIDTGGIHAKSTIPFNEQVKRQAEIAIEEADSLIMVVDSRIGVTTLDLDLSKILRKSGKPLCLAINKVDHIDHFQECHQFHSLAINPMIGVSATQSLNIAELCEMALDLIPSDNKEDHASLFPGIKIAIVGRANTGKSTLLNQILSEERTITSPIPGTTRDSIDIPWNYKGNDYVLIDTAGIRRKKAEHEVVDKFAAIRTQRAIDRCDICILVIDSTAGLTTQEKHIASSIEESGKACLLFFNKWDLVKGVRMEHCSNVIRDTCKFLAHCPIIFGSAKLNRNVLKVFDTIPAIYESSKTRISTSNLNKFMEKTINKCPPPMITGKRLRIYYLAQVDTSPPRFVFFVNFPSLLIGSYKRYLYNSLRASFGFRGSPIQFFFKKKKQTKH